MGRGFGNTDTNLGKITGSKNPSKADLSSLGARTTLDVLDAEQDLLDAETARLADEANLYVAAYAVLQATGRLTVKELNLGVQTYDPVAYYNLAKDAPTVQSEQGRQLDRVLRSLQKN